MISMRKAAVACAAAAVVTAGWIAAPVSAATPVTHDRGLSHLVTSAQSSQSGQRGLPDPA